MFGNNIYKFFNFILLKLYIIIMSRRTIKRKNNKSKKKRTTTNKSKRERRRTNKRRRTLFKKKRRSILGGTVDPLQDAACQYTNAEKVWPTNFGCELDEDEEIIVLPTDKIIDRFGHNYGYYFGDPSSSFDNRSLSLLKPNKNCENVYKEKVEDASIPYNQYRVIKEFNVKKCNIAPAFNHIGKGIQYRLFDGSVPITTPIKPKRDQSDANGNRVEQDMLVPNVQELIDNQFIEVIGKDNITIPPFD
jgi:hypothetical protein